MRRTFLIAVAALLCAAPAQAKLYYHHPTNHASRSMIHTSQLKNLAHSRYVCKNGAHANRIWHCKAVVWLKREAAETAPPPVNDWVSKQIAAANWIGSYARAHGAPDPWPNCPDPWFNGASWSDTVRCENGGNWYDSPGYFRCGLQFDPAWENRFGRLCP